MHIYRDLSEKFKQLMSLYPAVLVTGPRQSGKTSMVRNLAPNHKWVLLDNQEEVAFANDNPTLFINNNPAPVIYDEVQNTPRFFSELKYFIDTQKTPVGAFILTGSQPLPLMKHISESLAGRVGILELPPMTPAEINDFKGRPRFLNDWLKNPPIGEKFQSQKNPFESLVRGGFPAMALPHLSPESHDASQRLTDYFQTYLTKDLRDLAQIEDLGKFSRFVRQLSIYSARDLDLSEAARAVGVPQSTADVWFGLLEASMLAWRVPGYSKKLGKREKRRPKLYFCDSGLQANLLGYTGPEQIKISPMTGSIFETSAANAIKKIARSAGGALPLFHWRLDEKNEIDLVIEMNYNELCLVEIKFKATNSDLNSIKEFRRAYGKNHPAIIVSTNEQCFWMEDDILHMPWNAI